MQMTNSKLQNSDGKQRNGDSKFREAKLVYSSETPNFVLPVAQLHQKIPNVTDTPTSLNDVIQKLQNKSGPFAVDTERAEGIRYGSDAYLVQIKRHQSETFLIDPRALPDLRELATAMDDTWILHAAKQDLTCMKPIGLLPQKLFDTAIAAQLSGLRQTALAKLYSELLNMELDKTHQKEDWSVRPLPKDWLRYAALDVEYLTDLAEILTAKLVEKGRLEWAQQEFQYELDNIADWQPRSWRDYKGVGSLKDRRQLAYARELLNTREDLAKQHNLAPTQLISHQALLMAAQKMINRRSWLLSMKAFQTPRIRPYRDDFWRACQRAAALCEDELPSLLRKHDHSEPPSLQQWPRGAARNRLKAMRILVNTRARSLDLDPQVVLSSKVLRTLCYQPISSNLSGDALVEAVLERIRQAGARPWQIQQFELAIREHQDLLSELQE